MANDELIRLKTELNHVDNQVRSKEFMSEIFICLVVDFRSSPTGRTSG